MALKDSNLLVDTTDRALLGMELEGRREERDSKRREG